MWLYHPQHLFSSYKLIPEQGDSASDVANSLTRLLLLVVLILWWKSHEDVERVLLYGMIGIFVIYIIMTTKKEKFSPITYKMDVPSSTVVTPPPVPPTPPIENFRESGAHPASSGSYRESGQTENFRESGAYPASAGPYSVPLESTQESVRHNTLPTYLNRTEKENFREYGAHPAPRDTSTDMFMQQGPERGTQGYRTQGSERGVSIPVQVEPNTTSVSNLQYREPTVMQLQRELSVPRQPLETIDQPTVYGTRQTTHGNHYFTPNMGSNAKIYQTPKIAPRMMDSDFSTVNTNQPVNFNPLMDMGMNDERARYQSRPQKPKLGLLMERTEDPGVTAKSVASGNNKFYLQDIQPNLYSFSYDPTPINSSIGISYTPQIPPRQRTTIHTEDGKSYPMYTRIDPQLIRDDVPDQRREELPQRGPWSEGYDQFQTEPNSVYNIYDPRFTGYGDEYRSYEDVNLGNVKYYYTDVDAYRSPNFVIRNKVDHVDLHQPMGNTYSTYPREAALEDVRDIVNDDWMAKSTEHREDMMERIMRPANARNWQMRFAPQSSGAHLNSFTSGY
jgi:hypothetical protein